MFSPMYTRPNVLLSISDTAPGVRGPEGQGVHLTPQNLPGYFDSHIFWKEMFSSTQVS